jgi:SAM-dependent methyltransferase
MFDTHVDHIVSRVPVDGRDVVDVGSGTGALVRRLAGLGARVTGIEAGEAPLAAARAGPAVNGERTLQGVGQALPLSDASADLVVFLFSLHHVPVPLQTRALAEAARVLRPGGRLHVVEPVADGPYFQLLRWVEDETAVRAAALAALGEASSFGFALADEAAYLHRERFVDFEDFVRRAVLVDAARRAVLPQVEDQARAAFATHGRSEGGFSVFEQPVRLFHYQRSQVASPCLPEN